MTQGGDDGAPPGVRSHLWAGAQGLCLRRQAGPDCEHLGGRLDLM